MLRKSRLGIVRVARVREAQRAAAACAALDLLAGYTPFALDAYHLGLLDDADFFACSQMHEGLNAAGEAAFGVWNSCRVVGDEKSELELGVIIYDMVVFKAEGCCLAICC